MIDHFRHPGSPCDATEPRLLTSRPAAGDNRNPIAKAMAVFESKGSGRRRTHENAISETGIAFDFPEELLDQKPIYDELVAGNPQKTAPGSDARVQAEQQEAAQKGEELKAQIHELITILLTNREMEQAHSAAVYEELKKEEFWFSKPDVIVIADELNKLKPLYELWDKSLAKLKAVFTERGEGPERGRGNCFVVGKRAYPRPASFD